MFQVKLFAKARDLAGAPTIELSLPIGSSVSDLRRTLCDVCPALTPLAAGLLIAVNSQYAGDAATVPGDAEIACFPPVSGG